jgi:hypothetical protein
MKITRKVTLISVRDILADTLGFAPSYRLLQSRAFTRLA